jgi:hypothetical protein
MAGEKILCDFRIWRLRQKLKLNIIDIRAAMGNLRPFKLFTVALFLMPIS